MSCISRLPGCSISPIAQETPGGATNCSNLSYTTANKFEAGSLEVYVDGRRLTNILDFTEGLDLQSFTILLDPTDKNRLNIALAINEDLRVDYNKASSSDCVTIL